MKTTYRPTSHPLRPEPDTETTLQPIDSDEWYEFLRDPISYGNFEWDNPITLAEFSTSRHYRGRYVAPLGF